MPAQKKTAKSIWEKLSKINCNDQVETKNGLKYLSWSWAWGIMMENFPEMSVEWNTYTDSYGVTRDVCYYPGGTAMVSCTVTIGDVSRECWLPVLNFRNQALENPNTFEINSAKMRCMTKAFSLLGLGHYIYAGEDIPTSQGDKANALESAKKELSSLLKQIEADNDKVAEIDANVLESARVLLKDGKDPKRMQKASDFLKSLI